MKETESNILKETKYTMVIDTLLLNAWETVSWSEGNLHSAAKNG